jgi:uncharacterized protein YjbJ (UPF0337 family)
MEGAPSTAGGNDMGSTSDKLKGMAKKLQEALTGRTKKVEGALDEIKGEVKEKIEDAEHKIGKGPPGLKDD